MGSFLTKIGYESEDIHGQQRSGFSMCLDPVGLCLQPAKFNLYKQDTDEGPIPGDAHIVPAPEIPPTSPPPLPTAEQT